MQTLETHQDDGDLVAAQKSAGRDFIAGADLESPDPRRRLSQMALLLVIAVAACQTGGPTAYVLRFDAGAAVSADGLSRLDGTPFDEVWMDPAFDPSARRRVQVVPGSVVQADPKKGVAPSSDLRPDRYRLTEDQRTQLARDFAGLLEKAVDGNDALTFVGSADSAGVLLRASIDPLVMLAPMQPPGREDVYASQTAQLTLRVEVRDPETDRVLMRFVDAREVRGIPSTRAELQQADLYRVSPSSNLADIRRSLRLFSDQLVREYVRILEHPPRHIPSEGADGFDSPSFAGSRVRA